MPQEHATFGADELAICLSHYDTGIIRSIKPFPRGSRRAPKVVIDCQRGRLLFKRRSRGKADIVKVAFAHQVQLHLAGEGFPLPHLIGTRPDNNSMLVLNDYIYELFEFVQGGPYDNSLDATLHAGKVLGLYHKLLADFRSDYRPPTSSYHGNQAVAEAVGKIPSSLPMEGRPEPEVVMATVNFLQETYDNCARQADQAGLRDWPAQIVHGDWHPGNMLFRERTVVAVIDYDSSRLHQRVIDLANGGLQFSIVTAGEDPSNWPDELDEARLRRFLGGYDSVNVISKAELAVLPYLMCEAMIAEAVLPIAATGRIGRMEGFPFLQTIERKVKWVLAHVEELQGILKD